ncbi:fumarate reductase/succinate dehydrogenase flavoprotein domain protein [Xylanimonas cellulosilytica DSM 15894]|uniref:Fumarate reductase/succinate dehydrogenase flavoprotein domain protein n=1 Tax=Xylanimonas cellulosilytica (strain DSM 15894 / JCM 12276 / CECT 5975 / KCTC 9989 / LMG 20990 / NBRC 107835 / XIL07) TaxID=446471 RepID=D1BY83_XYLCX|nr:FAD-binding protein [Xylanimonas cellulosilytica]ACZ29926.1 fumarate reductase/succinate dehydrogenase flavoprotein domain protein [Xylanimonas cellulosilytica DSM 15894]
MDTLRIAGHDVPVLTANTVVVGTGSAGYCAAARLVQLGQPDVVMVADKIHAGASRNAGSDKQTYYKLTLSGAEPDSVREMAQTLFAGGAMDGDNALAEAALSARAFLHLVDLGVPFPQNRFGEFVGYKTDHDPRQRATSVGPYTSRTMVERLEARVLRDGVRVLGECRVVDVVTMPDGGGRAVAGLLVLRTDVPHDGAASPWLLLRCTNLVYATGGPAGMYATRVFPNGQWGASGAAHRAGVHGKNLTEWQFGLASTHPRWNVSGTYMQVIPRFVSTDAAGGDEREFLTEAIGDYGRLLSLVFLKGYQWPLDIRKARDGSSLIDLLVYRETVLRGRRVFLDFRRNPVRDDLDPSALSPEAYEYLDKAGVLFGTPVQRLRHMNEPAYQFYRDKNPYVDLETQLLEVDVCAQHNNGGLVVDAWWHSNVAGFFPVGEAGGAHGVYRPGGAALNSGQVGATRAAQYIAARRTHAPLDDDAFAVAAEPVLAEALALTAAATGRATAGDPDNTGELLRAAQELMSAKAGPVRSAASIHEALDQVGEWLAAYPQRVSADAGSRRSVDRTFLVRDILTSAYVYLSAMADYVAHGGRSRGSVLYTDASGGLPLTGYGPGAQAELDLPAEFRFVLDGGALDDVVQETAYTPGADAGKVTFTWRPRRPIPPADDFFENVWRDYRKHGNVR